MECPAGYVGTGLCGSREGNDCGTAQGYANMLICCKIRSDPNSSTVIIISLENLETWKYQAMKWTKKMILSIVIVMAMRLKKNKMG